MTGARCGRRSRRSRQRVTLFGGVAYLLHACLVVYSVALCAGALASRRLTALVLLFGVVGYTLVSAYFALSEFRRNLRFVPIVLCLSFYWPAKWSTSTADSRRSA